jgi:hypothetical protein
MLLESVTPEDVRAVVAKLVDLAKSGDLAAVRELLDRLFGKPTTPIATESIEPRISDRVRILEDDDWYGNADRCAAVGAWAYPASTDNSDGQ